MLVVVDSDPGGSDVVAAEEPNGGADLSPDEHGGMSVAGFGPAEIELIDLGDGGELGECGSEIGAAVEAAGAGTNPEVAVQARHRAESGEGGVHAGGHGGKTRTAINRGEQAPGSAVPEIEAQAIDTIRQGGEGVVEGIAADGVVGGVRDIDVDPVGRRGDAAGIVETGGGARAIGAAGAPSKSGDGGDGSGTGDPAEGVVAAVRHVEGA